MIQRNADYFIKEILTKPYSITQMKELKKEVDVWFKNASEAEKERFSQSGAAEVIEMCCI